MTKFLGSADAILQAFRESVASATSVDVSVAWASPGPALDLLCDAATKGLTARIVVGCDFNGTHPAAIERLFRSFPGRLRWSRLELGATFHPKVYLFVAGAGQKLLIGSANLTLAGFTRNVETAVLVDDRNAIADAAQWFQAVWDHAEPVDQRSLDNYAERYERSAIRKRRAEKKDEEDITTEADSADTDGARQAEILEMSSRLLSLNWQEYEVDLRRIEAIWWQNVKWHTLAGPHSRLESIEQLTPLLEVPLQNASKAQRAALFGDDETQATYLACAWLGRMNGAGMARKLLSKEGHQSSKAQKTVWKALMSIPTRGERRPTMTESRRLYESIRQIGGIGGAVATRYMTIRRPDCYVSINGASIDGLSRVFDIPVGRLGRWDGVAELLERLWKAPWMNARQPVTGLEQRIWLARTALMDAFVYQPLGRESPPLEDLLPHA